MVETRTAIRGAAWIFYAIFVLEILFMISPAALYFYALFGPALRLLNDRPETAWLTQFFLPHISRTGNPILDLLPSVGGVLLLAGAVLFLAAAVPLYWSKIRHRGEVTGGIYRFIRHPQYVGLAVMGFGVLLLWPRFLVLVSLVLMLGLYRLLAGWEEQQCLARFGDTYRAYLDRTGMFLPRALERRLPRILPPAGTGRAATALAIFLVVMSAAIAGAFALRDYSLGQIAAVYRLDEVILSPAPLTEPELDGAYRAAMEDAAVRAALDGAPAGKRLVYVIPEHWYLPDLPVESGPAAGSAPHGTAAFDRTHFKLLFANARSHDPGATGSDIVKKAYGLDPIIVARVDTATGRVTAVEQPPAHVRWGDIPTPTF